MPKIKRYNKYLLATSLVLGLIGLATFVFIGINSFAARDDAWQIHQVLDYYNVEDLDSFDGFGYSADVYGDYLVVGVPFKDKGIGNLDAGMVYVFKRNKSEWVFDQTLEPSVLNIAQGITAWTRNARGNFGLSVAINDNYIAVGQPYDDVASIQGWLDDSGSVYIFKKQADGSWENNQIINSKESLAFDWGVKLKSKDLFGRHLSLNNDTLVISAPTHDGYRGGDNRGAVYIFKEINGKWVFNQEIADGGSGFAKLRLSNGDEFGSSLALSDNRLVVGSYKQDGLSGKDTGAVYVFIKNNDSNYFLEQKLSDEREFNDSGDRVRYNHYLQASSQFGYSVSIDDRILAVGAPGHNVKDYTRGAVFIFELSPHKKFSGQIQTRRQHKQYRSPVASLFSQSRDGFGHSVLLNNNYLVVGTYDRVGFLNTKAIHQTRIYYNSHKYNWVFKQVLKEGEVRALSEHWLLIANHEAYEKSGFIKIFTKRHSKFSFY